MLRVVSPSDFKALLGELTVRVSPGEPAISWRRSDLRRETGSQITEIQFYAGGTTEGLATCFAPCFRWHRRSLVLSVGFTDRNRLPLLQEKVVDDDRSTDFLARL